MTDLVNRLLTGAKWVEANARYHFSKHQKLSPLQQSIEAAEAMREAASTLTHPSPVNGAVEGVKGLEWEYGQKTARASVPFGEYQVDEYTETDGIGYAAIFNDNDELGEFPIIDEAIAACQADFAKRVSSCLSTLATPTPAVTVDRMREVFVAGFMAACKDQHQPTAQRVAEHNWQHFRSLSHTEPSPQS